jgi:hypothetical protein
MSRQLCHVFVAYSSTHALSSESHAPALSFILRWVTWLLVLRVAAGGLAPPHLKKATYTLHLYSAMSDMGLCTYSCGRRASNLTSQESYTHALFLFCDGRQAKPLRAG